MLDRLNRHRPRPGRDRREPWRIAAKTLIHEAGDWGKAWRVVHGAIRLDDPGDGRHADRFAGLALPGDLVGAEMLIGGHYHFQARSIVPCVLVAWPTLAEENIEQGIQAHLLEWHRRTAQSLSLRHGTADDRLQAFIALLTQQTPVDPNGGIPLQMPGLRDIADITALTMETASRSITKLRQQGALQDLGQRQFLFFPLTPVPAAQAPHNVHTLAA